LSGYAIEMGGRGGRRCLPHFGGDVTLSPGPRERPAELLAFTLVALPASGPPKAWVIRA